MNAITGNMPVEVKMPARVLVVGNRSQALAGALVRMQADMAVTHASSPQDALASLEQGSFDHVLVDNRQDGTLTLMIPQIARLSTVSNIIVLAGPESSDVIASIPKVGAVFCPPYNAADIARSLGVAVVDQRRQNLTPTGVIPERRATDMPAPGTTDAEQTGKTSEAVSVHDNDAATDPLSRLRTILAAVPNSTAILSMLYKNVALVILASLFVAFVSYGIMIAFFLTNSGWSTPLQLANGHEMVMKAQRDLDELHVKRNLVSQQISDATHSAAKALQSIQRGETLAALVKGTVKQEIASRRQRNEELQVEVPALREILSGMGSHKQQQAQIEALKRDFKRRVITRSAYDGALLSLVQVQRQARMLETEIREKQSELDHTNEIVGFLRNLDIQLEGGQMTEISGGPTELVPLSNQVMEATQVLSQARSELAIANEQLGPLKDSLRVLNAGIGALEGTPLIRAVENPVTVLFVPYDNLNSYTGEEPLYACGFAIFWCSNVGKIGSVIPGEFSTTHPFFGKPMRGQFVEAKLKDQQSGLKELLHASRPLFF
ncbi:MAG: hypothetical protein WBO55_03160 [Rhizobiaceae bacterium]